MNISKNKQITILVILVVVFVVLLGINMFITSGNKDQTPTSSGPVVVNPQGDTLEYEDSDKRISYLPQTNEYIITIISSPFEKIRSEAETKFLEVTRLTRQSACDYKVTVSTPAFANPDYAGIAFPLSFCPAPSPQLQFKPSPRLIIKNELPDIVFDSQFPQADSAELGGTTNAVFLKFSQPLDVNTVAIGSSITVPFIASVFADNPKQLVIYPLQPWKIGEKYTVTIKAGLTSSDGKVQLHKDVTATFDIKAVPPPPADDDYNPGV